MSTLNFNDLLQAVADGQPVAAGVVDLPLAQLDARTRYIWGLLQAALAGQSLVISQATIEPAALVGMAVYFNSTTAQFERALSGVTLDPNSGALVTANSARVWGIVLQKVNSTLASILVYGMAPLNINAALESGQPNQAGSYYLSRVTPGALTASKLPIPVLVLENDGQGNVFVHPEWEDLINNHSHLYFALQPIPAGTHHDPGAGNRHVITDPNVHVEGWLPADHPVFNGKAPHDAVFGYNISANVGLKNAWPPLAPQYSVLLQDGIKVPSGEDGLVVMDTNGIWWMSDCYDFAPFPPGYASDFEDTSLSASVSETVTGCPPPYRMRLDLYFTQFAFMTASTVVTSLASGDKRIIVYCGNTTNGASVGPLQLALNLQFMADAVDPGGYIAFKTFDPVTQKFHAGPIVTSLYTQNPNITLTGDAEETVGDLTLYRGNIGIDVVTTFNRELPPQITRLDGATEEYFEDVMYLSLNSATPAALRLIFNVPETLDLVNPNFALQLRLLGFSAGTLPELTVTARRIPEPGDSPAVLPASDTAVTINTAITLVDVNQYVEVGSTPFAIQPGDDILFTVSRAAPDGYTDDVGILRIMGLVTPG